VDLVGTPTALRRWSVATLVANMAIVVTGGLVRVTGSGLGCPTWPQCTAGSYVPHAASDLHAFIEFGNRTLTFVLVAIAVGTWLAARRARDAQGRPRRLVRALALTVGLGIVAQAVIGGISVLMQLNPWVVALHLVPSVGLIGVGVLLVHEAWDVPPAAVRPWTRRVVVATFCFGLLAMVLGTIVTGAGPNSGDGGAARNGLDLASVARVHSLSVWVVVALTIALVVLTANAPRARRSVVLLLVVELVQAAIGYAQYLLALPAALVALHMVGTTLFAAALTHLWWLTRSVPQRPPLAELSVANDAEAS
jgi:cytochrome c oxidase assembly protein subunit 15